MRLFLFIMVLATTVGSQAQTIEVNPNIDWSYVRTQQLELQSGRTYQFEVPGERGHDYVFNLAHKLEGVFASIAVFDMQYGPVKSIVDSTNNQSLDLNFRVKDNGTYIVVVILATDQADVKLPATLSLVRRPIIAY